MGPEIAANLRALYKETSVRHEMEPESATDFEIMYVMLGRVVDSMDVKPPGWD